MSLGTFLVVDGAQSASWNNLDCWRFDLSGMSVVHPLSRTAQLWQIGLWFFLHVSCFLDTFKNLPPAWIILCSYVYTSVTHSSIFRQIGPSPWSFLRSFVSKVMICHNTLSIFCFMVPFSILHCGHMAYLCYSTFRSFKGRFHIWIMFIFPAYAALFLICHEHLFYLSGCRHLFLPWSTMARSGIAASYLKILDSEMEEPPKI